jgi:hypothetical protein
MSDVKEAAERLRRLRGSESGAAVYEFVPIPLPAGGFMWPGEAMARHERDRALVERAYLALVPADSDEPITAEWLREMGFKPWDIERDAELYELYILMSDEIGWECRLAYQSNGFYAVRICDKKEFGVAESVELLGTRNKRPTVTRGAVRQLLSALGIPTSKETPND